MTDLPLWIERCRNRLNRGLVLRVLAEWFAVWLCAFGTLLVLAKVAWPASWPMVLWLGATVIPVIAFAIRRALRDAYSPSDGAALLDSRLKAGGLLMAVAEKPDGRWREQLPRDEGVWQMALPKLRPVRFARIVVLPLAFAIVALLLPARQVPTTAATAKRPLPAVEELPEMLADLKRAEVLDPEEAGFLREEIAKLVDSTAKAPPTPETWRKIDALRARLNDRLDRESRTIEKGRRAAQKLAQAGKNGVPPLTKEQRRQLEKDLADALKRSRQGKAEGGGRKAESGKQKAESGKKTTDADPSKAATRGTNIGHKVTGKSGEPKMPAGKTPATGAPMVKTPAGKKSPGKSSAKKLAKKLAKKDSHSPGLPLPKFDPSNLRDLAKIAKFVESLPPEMQERLRKEVMRMIRSGKVEIPRDPAVREMLLKQARRMLEQDGRRLEDLRKRFGHLAGNMEQWKRLELRDRESSGETGNEATGEGGPQKTVNGGAKRSDPAVSFRDVVLPPGLFGKPRTDPDSVSGRRPTIAPFRPTTPTAQKSDADPAGDRWRALRRKVRPRNRGLVYRYFGKDEK